jgi:hypothetical protein
MSYIMVHFWQMQNSLQFPYESIKNVQIDMIVEL